ncbi:Iron sulfur domain-containing, CDGSH-type [Syntrophobotulus glycolicus DSM 8271]|uniref:Iron sulfur domain-containing, CDGSH-type n=1 Tax=Syntrophobotulus glycolicus (strain DSM 8271 / FlGlyR) TaxID=645991 RepID=F0SYW7_SYNGF|nr:CDGSH iron-sulfur domain-containing protein [Syntrophobotulus glycolicus]ADY56004.1 Iron sulfur domain-containing, CDGSH-type [Syntrophobotulus glycolicus DSM 8271]
MNKKTIITFTQNGPYLVHNLDSLENSKGDSFATGPVITLCRCGASKAKPYCDGAHREINFQGRKKADRIPSKINTYLGENITVHFDLSICAHSAICLNTLPSVFDLSNQPWINPNGADPQKIIEAIKKCPSGALSYTLEGKRPSEENSQFSKITIIKNGPLNVEGNVELQGDIDSPPADPEHFCLCRCGHTKNSPYCDGSHIQNHFRAD